MSTDLNYLTSTQTIHRKPNTLTLKPLRRKAQLNSLHEQSIPLTSSRLHHYDEQMPSMTGTTNNSSNQTTPRSIRPTMKTKIPPPINSHSNEDSTRISRTTMERTNPFPLTMQPRRGILQQMIPFDASPSKMNNLLIRHHLHQTNPFHPSKANILFSLNIQWISNLFFY